MPVFGELKKKGSRLACEEQRCLNFPVLGTKQHCFEDSPCSTNPPTPNSQGSAQTEDIDDSGDSLDSLFVGTVNRQVWLLDRDWLPTNSNTWDSSYNWRRLQDLHKRSI